MSRPWDIARLLPNGDDSVGSFSVTGATYHYDAINDGTDGSHDSNTTHVSIAGTGSEQYSIETLSGPPSTATGILTVKVCAAATSSSTVRVGITIGGTTYWSSDLAPTTSYAWYSYTWHINPATNTFFVPSDFSGLKVNLYMSCGWEETCKATALYLEYAYNKSTVQIVDYECTGVSSSTSLTIDTPSCQPGDILLAVTYSNSSTTITPPNGFSHFKTSTNRNIATYIRVADGSESSSYTFTYSSSILTGALLVSIRSLYNDSPSTAEAVDTYSVGAFTVTQPIAPHLIVARCNSSIDTTTRYVELLETSYGSVYFSVQLAYYSAGSVSSFNVDTDVLALMDTTGLCPVNVYYAVCPGSGGTSDKKTGSPTITISGGVATLSVAQTGNIGQGFCVDYDTDNKKAYISLVNSATSFDVVTATGGVPSNCSGLTVNSISAPFNSLSAAESGASGSSYLNTSDLTSGNYVLNIVCYAGASADTTALEINGYTTDPTHFINIYTPTGGTQSINNQRHSGVSNNQKYRLNVSANNAVKIRVPYARLTGLQISFNTTDTDQSGVLVDYSGTSDIYVDSCIIDGNSGDWINYNSGVMTGWNCVANVTVKNCIIKNIGVYGGAYRAAGIYCFDGAFNAYNNTIYGCSCGVGVAEGTLNVVNCAIFNNNDDFYNDSGTLNVSYTASDDNDISGTGNFQIGTWSSIFTDYANGDVSLKNFTGTGSLINAGTTISGMPAVDIIGTSRPQGSAWDIGAFEYVSAGTSLSPSSHAGSSTITSPALGQAHLVGEVAENVASTITACNVTIGEATTSIYADALGTATDISSVAIAERHHIIVDPIGASDSVSDSMVSQRQTIAPSILGMATGITPVTMTERYHIIAASIGASDSVSVSTILQAYSLIPSAALIGTDSMSAAIAQAHHIGPDDVSYTDIVTQVNVSQLFGLVPAAIGIDSAVTSASATSLGHMRPEDMAVASSVTTCLVQAFEAGWVAGSSHSINVLIPSPDLRQLSRIDCVAIEVATLSDSVALSPHAAVNLVPDAILSSASIAPYDLSQAYVFLVEGLDVSQIMAGPGLIVKAVILPSGMRCDTTGTAPYLNMPMLQAYNLTIRHPLAGLGLRLKPGQAKNITHK